MNGPAPQCAFCFVLIVCFVHLSLYEALLMSICVLVGTSAAIHRETHKRIQTPTMLITVPVSLAVIMRVNGVNTLCQAQIF